MNRSRSVFLAITVAMAMGLIAAPANAADPRSAATVPGAPTITTTTSADRTVTVAFTAPTDNGGATISNYRVTCAPIGGGENKTGFSRTSPIRVQALSLRTAYSCSVRARNRVGPGPFSAPVGVNIGAGTVCAGASGTATFTPALPKISDKTLVDTVLTTSGTVSGCIGGGVTSGTLDTTSLPSAGTNCTTVAGGKAAPFPSTATITWNTNATSTIALTIQQVKGKITQTTLTGTVTAGLFVGLHASGLSSYALPKTGCVTTPLATLTYTQFRPWLLR